MKHTVKTGKFYRVDPKLNHYHAGRIARVDTVSFYFARVTVLVTSYQFVVHVNWLRPISK